MQLETLKTVIFSNKLDEILSNGVNGYYLSYPIQKSSGGKRWIDAPLDDLKFIQEQILYNILYIVTPHEAAIGFRPGMGLTDGADRHLNQKALLNVDLADFFHSVNFRKVSQELTNATSRLYHSGVTDAWSSREVYHLAELCTFNRRLPQGAPTSPALSNLASRNMDLDLEELADKYDLVYTRYADDMSFSHATGELDFLEVYEEIRKIVSKHKFKVNTKKTRIQRSHQRMVVTGIVVNEKKSVPKWKWRAFRAELHNLKKSGQPVPKGKIEQLRGYAQWIHQLHPKRGTDFLETIGSLRCE